MLVLQSLIIGLITFLVALLASFWWSRRRLYYLAAKLPGPKGIPLLGLAHKIINADFKEIFDLLSSLSQNYGSPVSAWLGPEFVVVADTPESLQIVLNSQKCLNKSPLYDVLILTKGLLVGSGDLWKRHRKILNPAFSIGILQKIIPTFDDKAKIFVRNMEAKVGGEAFDVYEYMSPCSLESLLKVTMDYDRDFQSKPLDNEYLHHIEL